MLSVGTAGTYERVHNLLEDALRIRRRDRDFRGQISTLRCISVTEKAASRIQVRADRKTDLTWLNRPDGTQAETKRDG